MPPAMPASPERLAPAAMLARLVAFDTVSARSNLALIEFVKNFLASHGVEARILRSPDGAKANLLATIGPTREGGVILSGHTDVVPVEDQPWTGDPFRLEARDGRLYGRGSADMKGFIAVALALAPEFLAAGLKRPIHLAFSHDEEVGCRGVPALIAAIARELPRPALAIVGEPTEMRLANRHKGIYGFETVVTGRDGHSSAPDAGLNAIMAAAEILGFLDRLAAEFRESGPFDTGFQPPHTTLNVGEIAGGTALNIVARQCRIRWEFRPVPDHAPDLIRARLDRFVGQDLLPRLKARAAEAAVETRALACVPGLRPEVASPAEALVRHLTGLNEAIGVAFTTEAGLFQEAGFPAVVIGPGSIAQAHQPDEFVEESQLEACARFLRRLAQWAAEG
ncbi:MAG: acetylornithine deacetylase [Pseudomonadota bacterium]